MRVGIKYCGGCDPAYDRLDYVNRIQEAAGSRIEWVRYDEQGLDALLLVCGCDAECIELTSFTINELPIISIRTDQETPEKIVSNLLKKRGKP